MYELYFNWKFIWKKVGLASLTTNSTTYHSEPAIRVESIGISRKKPISFLRCGTPNKRHDGKLEPRYFRKGAEEGKRYTVDEPVSLCDGMCYVNQKRVRKDGSITETEQSDTRCIYDMLTILAQARSFDPKEYTVGQRIQFPMATGRRVEEQTLIYRGIRRLLPKTIRPIAA